MNSIPGSDRATPLHGQVVLVPSIRNWFSLVPEPNAETVVAVALVPLEGEVGDTPGAARRKSNMLARRVGMALMSWYVNRVLNPGSRTSIRDPAPSTTIDSATPARFIWMVRGIVDPALMLIPSSWKALIPGAATSRV